MRSIVVHPSAIRPAITRQAEARRSVAITFAAVSLRTPLTTAVLPPTSISAPRRLSSWTCIIRFSKTVSMFTPRDPGAHRVEAFGEVGHFGLARRILERGDALGERSGHHQVFGAGDGDDIEDERGPDEPPRLGVDIAVVEIDLGAQGLQPLDVL